MTDFVAGDRIEVRSGETPVRGIVTKSDRFLVWYVRESGPTAEKAVSRRMVRLVTDDGGSENA